MKKRIKLLLISFVLILFSFDSYALSSESSPLELERRTSYGGYFGEIRVSGNYAFVGAQTGLKIFSISNPASPNLAGSYDLPRTIDNISVSGTKVYLTLYKGNFLIFDVSKPSKPEIIGGIQANGFEGMYVAGKKVYLIQTDLKIYKVRKPESPKLLGSYKLPDFDGGSLKYVTVYNNIAYMGYTKGSSNTLRMVDVSKPSDTKFLGEYEIGYSIEKIRISGGTAYVYGNESGDEDKVTIVNVSSPSSPVLITEYVVENPTDISISGKNVFIPTNDSGMRIMDFTNPAEPVTNTNYVDNNLWKISISGDKAYFTGPAGLFVMDISVITSPVLLGSYNTVSYALGITISGTTAYVANGYGGLVILDIADPLSPAFLGAIDTKGYANRVFVSDNKAYIADGTKGLVIADVSVLTAPVVLGSYKTTNAQKVYGSGSYAYIADGDSYLYVCDVSEPSSPELVNYYKMGDSPTGLYVMSNTVYAANRDYDSNKGLFILDVSGDFPPALLSHYNDDNTKRMEGLYVISDTAYVTVSGAGLTLLDVSDPSSPQFISELGVSKGSGALFVSEADDKAYFFGKNWTGNIKKKDGIGVVNLTNPLEPSLLTIYELGSAPNDISVSDSFVYLAFGLYGIEVVDASDPVELLKLNKKKGRAGALVQATGDGFGDVQGSVIIKRKKKEKECTVSSWSASEVTFKIPKGVNPGKAKVFVKNSHGRKSGKGLAFKYLKKK